MPLSNILPADQHDAEPSPYRTRWLPPGVLRTLSSFLVSLILHLALLVTLGLWVMPEIVREPLPPLIVKSDEPQEELETVELDERIEAATELTFATDSLANVTEEVPEVSDPNLDDTILEQDTDNPRIALQSLDYYPGRERMLSEVPLGAPGKARSVVDNYSQAIDRITREIIWMLSKSKVLAIWCFDQSESMKDDQQEIRGRIERVYAELGLTKLSGGDALTTAVTSYGQDFIVHTNKPTSDLQEICEAIDSVPIDPSGKEIMCQAVGRSIALHRNYVNRTQRRMALILVTDESGDRSNNAQYLEETIAVAKASRCKVFILGREAVFGYPYARMRWKHPQTERIHWIVIDRGPETAFVEQIQTDGFHRRWDAFPSGFGPYEQSRLAHQTGGIFFLLPSKEVNIVRGEKRRYQLEAMRGYRPDLRARQEIFFDRDKSKLQMMLWGIISDLNPYNKQSAKVIEMRIHLSLKFDTFVPQVQQEHVKAKTYLAYLDQAIKLLEANRRLRDDESSLRWQANYDLIHAQLLAYKVRIYEYGVYLDQFVNNPKVPPMKSLPNRYLHSWAITTRKKTLTGELTQPTIDRANELFAQVIKNHPGTPWAARANWERNRGFGVKLYPYYDHLDKKFTGKRIPIPEL